MRNNKYTYDEVKTFFFEHNLILDSCEYRSNKETLQCHDKDGYKYQTCMANLLYHIPEKFHKKNPYIIYNIRNYSKLYNIRTELLSEEYINRDIKLIWKCECGNVFSRSWDLFCQGNKYCEECNKNNHLNNMRTKLSDVVSVLDNNDLILLNKENLNEYFIASNPDNKIEYEDKEGYRYSMSFISFTQGNRCSVFSVSNKYLEYNLRLYIDKTSSGAYEMVFYDSKTNNITLKHLLCGNSFVVNKRVLTTKRYNFHCSFCSHTMNESHHATILKRICLYYEHSTIIEDPSCYNKSGKRCMPTDIVIHDKKIAIEIQSEYHDTLKQKEKDKYKKDFWENKGYTVYAPDIRDYTVLEMIQLFFPFIKEIPKWADYKYNNSINDGDIKYIQNLIDNGCSVTNISCILNIPRDEIVKLIKNNVFNILDYDKLKLYNKTRKVVWLLDDGTYKGTYVNQREVSEASGVGISDVSNILNKKRKYCYNNHFVYEDEYKNNNYILPQKWDQKYIYKVGKYDKKTNELIKIFDTALDVAKDINIDVCFVQYCVEQRNGYKTLKGYKYLKI